MSNRSNRNPFTRSRGSPYLSNNQGVQPNSAAASVDAQETHKDKDIGNGVCNERSGDEPPENEAMESEGSSSTKSNATRFRRDRNSDQPVTRRALRLPDQKWEQLAQIGRTLLPKQRVEQNGGSQDKPVAYAYALELLLDHLSEREVREWIEARRMTARKHRQH